MNTIRNTVARKGAWLSTIALVAAMHLAETALAQATPKPPERMTYQGFIAGSDGVALGNTAPKNYDVIFRVYDAETGGILIWGEQQTATVDKGYFSVLLGEGAPVSGIPNAGITLSSLFNSATASDRFVQFTVKGIGTGGADVDILPRARMMSAPYAFLASRAGVATLAESANVATTALTAAVATNALTTTMATNALVANTAVKLVRDNISGTELIGHGLLTTNTLDIIGSGTNAASGRIKFHNGGGAVFTGAVTNEGITMMNSTLFLKNTLGFTTPSEAVIDLGYGVAAPKATAAGQIAYRKYSGDSLDIIGAGTSDATRKIRFWSEGGMHINSAVGIGHQPAPGSYMLFLNTAPSGISLWASGACFASGFSAYSDRRNKDVVGVSDRSQDLENLRKIRVTDYTLKFGGVGGKRPTKGVIAQELGEVLPNAVSLSRNIIPVPAQDAVSVEKDGPQSPVVVRFAAAHGFQKDERLRLEIDGRTEEVQILNVPDEKSFELSGGPTSAPKQVRVIGREVDDFQSVDYQQIYMTAISALQDVDRRLQVVEQREARMETLERKAARVETLENDVAQLRKLVADIQATSRKAAESASTAGSPAVSVANAR
jgi:Chaperone of endosialidase